jgi:hypothetical protein
MSKKLDYREDVEGSLREDLPSWISGPRVNALIQAAAETCFQDVEDKIFNVWSSTTIDTSSGEALRQWGELFGEPERELTPEQYKNIISAKITAVNNSSSSPDLVQIYKKALNAEDVLRVEAYPAGVSLTGIVSSMPPDYYSYRVRKLMEEVSKTRGIGIALKVAFPDYIEFGGSIDGNTTARVL